MLIWHVTLYIGMFNNSKRLKKSKKVTLKLVIFSVDFSHRWLRISETNDHTKILESNDYVFKFFVILRFYRKTSISRSTVWHKKIQPNMTYHLKIDLCNPNILASSVVSRNINTLCEKPKEKMTGFPVTFLKKTCFKAFWYC